MSTGRLKPVTKSDKSMAKSHLKASVRYNESHARDHKKAATAARGKLHSSYVR